MGGTSSNAPGDGAGEPGRGQSEAQAVQGEYAALRAQQEALAAAQQQLIEKALPEVHRLGSLMFYGDRDHAYVVSGRTYTLGWYLDPNLQRPNGGEWRPVVVIDGKPLVPRGRKSGRQTVKLGGAIARQVTSAALADPEDWVAFAKAYPNLAHRAQTVYDTKQTRFAIAGVELEASRLARRTAEAQRQAAQKPGQQQQSGADDPGQGLGVG
jgi:hypothetical protein